MDQPNPTNGAATTTGGRRKQAASQPAPAAPVEARSFEPSEAHKPAPATPSRTFRLPGGKRVTLATDRVRARPAVTPQVSFMLGQNAIGLGVWGLLAPKGVNRFLGLNNSPQMTQALFGARELATGIALFSDPTRSSALWARVAGDMFDIAVLSTLNRPSNPKRGNARLALGVVLAVTALDAIAAVRMSNVQRTQSQEKSA
jgi:hypothetical protein